MIGSTYVNLRYFFYPVGNTPAVNLLQDRFRPASIYEQQEPFKVLSLACGDPRNLLFSLWCESADDQSFRCEFTCCDIEPAVLARNLVLFSLIIHNAPSASTWNIFYHFYIPEHDVSLLKQQLEKLIAFSESSTKWSSSIYGKAITFLSQDTLERLRGFWLQYARISGLEKEEKDIYNQCITNEIKKKCKEHIRGETTYLHVLRVAGLHWSHAHELFSTAFKRYWETGVVAGNEQDMHKLGHSRKGCVNPLFSISSAPTNDFAVHYGTDPLLGFHLSSALDDKKCSQQELTDKVVQLAKSQFQDWCSAFQGYVRSDAITIRLFCGEAVRFCYELKAMGDFTQERTKLTRLYVAPWTSKELHLQVLNQSNGKETFDVIDTSNLIDHVGMLNVIPAAATLLSRRVTSVLYTDPLLQAAQDPTTTLSTLLCSDVTTMSLVLGLAPVGNFLGYTAEAVGIEAIRNFTMQPNTGRQQQYHMRIAWKIPDWFDRSQLSAPAEIYHQTEFDAEQLAGFLFKLYLSMFSYEDLGSAVGNLMRQSTSPMSSDLRHYNRASFVMLLYFVQCHVQTDWHSCMNCLVDMMKSDRKLIIGSNSLQEMEVLFYAFGIHNDNVLEISPRDIAQTPYGQIRPREADNGLLGREQVPPVVFVALTVPRKCLEIFSKQDNNKVGTPGLYISVRNLEQGFDNSFFGIQCFFGSLVKSSEDDSVCNVIPDELGWRGNADLIATCAVPAWSLLLGSRESLLVCLTIKFSPATVAYTAKLGPHMTVFGCGLDGGNLYILSEPPGVRFRPRAKYKRLGQFHHFSSEKSSFITLSRDYKATTVKMRKSAMALKKSSTVVTKQISPCGLIATIGGSEVVEFHYPYPIDGKEKKVRLISNSAIEINVPLAPALVHGACNHSLFPICLRGEQSVSLSLPSVKLEQQTIINLRDDLNWVQQFMGLTLSARERTLHNQNDPKRSNGLFGLKISLNAIFQSFVGINSNYGKIYMFQLAAKHKNNSVDTLIFASALRHHISQNSIVLDAHVVLLTKKRSSELRDGLISLVHSGQLLNINVRSREEEVLWKQMIPALTECCRRTWHHGKNCEYRTTGHVPLSTAHSEIPICSCGQGKDIKDFPTFLHHEKFAKYATRIALMPLFAIPYVESFATEEMRQQISQLQSYLNLGASDAGCDNCGKCPERLKRCSRCQKAKYCNHDCQKAAWKNHKKECEKSDET